MSYQECAPHAALRPFVDRFWVRTGAGPEQELRILPDGCVDLLVGERGALVVGTMTRALVITARPHVRTVAVRFRPGGASPFLRAPIDAFTDREVPCRDLGLRWLDGAEWNDAHDGEGSVRRLERVLLRRLSATCAPDPRVVAASRALLGPSPSGIAELAHRLGCSRQHLARTFKAHVGIGPKELAKVARLQRALATVQCARSNLARIAIQAGYFDEAHMDRDFRELAGVTPKQAQAAVGSIRPIRSLFGAP